MPWTDPKVNWNENYEPSPEDMNRIEENMQWLYDRIYGEVGDVGWYPTSTRPRRLLCDGSTITSSAYPELVDVLKAEAGADTSHPFYHADSDKAVLPNITDRFVRAMGGSRKAGEFQADALESHTHNTTIGAHYHDMPRRDWPGTPQTDIGMGPTGNFTGSENYRTSTVDLGTKGSGSPIGASTSSETRPDNITLYPLIKY